MSVLSRILLIILAVAGGVCAVDDDWQLLPLSEAQRRRVLSMSPLGPPPADPTNYLADDPRAARLGQILFFDTRLSSNAQVSCATCHDPRHGFSNGKQFGEGIRQTARNVPTLLNIAHHRSFFWDGRADTLWAQALRPMEHEDEMGFDRAGVLHLIAGDQQLRRSYEQVFGLLPGLIDMNRIPRAAKPMDKSPDDARHRAWVAMSPDDQQTVNRVFSNVGKAIAAYERLLMTPPAAFDVFVEGLRDADAAKQRRLSVQAQRGLQLFVGQANCHMCHSGALLSDQSFHNIGLAPGDDDGWRDSGRFDGIGQLQADPFNAAGVFSDDPNGKAARRLKTYVAGTELWGAFKTASLRSLADTAPYMHQGQLRSLDDVVRFYVRREGAVPTGHHADPLLPRLELTDEQMADLLAFLETLAAPPLPASLTQPPALPTMD